MQQETAANPQAVTFRHMRDDASPGGNIGGDAYGFYIGGMALHTWTRQQIAAQGKKPAIPIWVYGLGQQKGPNPPRANDEAAVCASMLRSMGIKHGPVMLDMETRVDEWWINIFTDQLNLFGYFAVVYGSYPGVTGNPERGGYFAATLDGNLQRAINLLNENPSLVGVQWRDFGNYDDSLIRQSFFDRLWRPA